MASSSKSTEILQAAVAGIPQVAKKIAALPADNRARALDAVEQVYRHTVTDLGCEEEAGETWVWEVMVRLRAKLAERDLAEQRHLKIPQRELVEAASALDDGANEQLAERKASQALTALFLDQQN